MVVKAQADKNKFNREALSERFVVALSALAGSVGQVANVSSLRAFLGTVKSGDIDLQQLKSASELCGFSIATDLYSKGLKQLKLPQRHAVILLLNTPSGIDFVYVYNPAQSGNQTVATDLTATPHGDSPNGDGETPTMFFDNEIGDGLNSPKQLNDLYWQGQARSDSTGFTFSKLAFRQVFDVVGHIISETTNIFVNLIKILLFPFYFIKRQFAIWCDLLRYTIKVYCINYLKRVDKKQSGWLHKLFIPLHWLGKLLAKFILTNIGETSQRIVTPNTLEAIRVSSLSDKDIELLNSYKYYRVSNGVLCEVKSDAQRLNKIFSSLVITAEKLTPNQTDSYSSILQRVSKRHWLWSLVQRQKPIYMRLIIATAIINMFAVIGSFYAMTVYDKIVPNNAIETLWTLSIGMVIMYIFDYILQLCRSVLSNKAGADIDLSATKQLFNQLVGVRLQYLKGSTTHLATAMRDFTTVAEFFTSATLLTLVELPFLFVYLFVMAQINLSLMLVLLAVVVIVVILGLFTLPMLNSAVKQAVVDRGKKQAVLMEAISTLETIKTSTSKLINQRFHAIAVATTYSNKRVKFLSQVITYTMGFMRQISSVGVVIIGVYAISTQSMTTGGLIAGFILLGRALAPITQVANILTRIQQVRSSMLALDSFMMTPTEHENRRYLSPVKKLSGRIELHNVGFRGGTQGDVAVLNNINLKINSGEKVGILGRTGSGKSTLLKTMFGINIATTGHILYDGVDYRQIATADLRARIGYVAQQPVLVSGTILENLTLGNPNVRHEEIITVCKLLGIDKIVAKQPNGYKQKLCETGAGLSLGQKQLLAIAQTLLKKPNIIFMDEPTALLDDFAVQAVSQALSRINVTLVLVAHSQAILTVVERLIVLQNGRIIADGAKDKIIQAINAGKITPK